MWISQNNVRRDLEKKTSGVQPAQGFPAACAKGLNWRFGGGRTLPKGHLLTPAVQAALMQLLLGS